MSSASIIAQKQQDHQPRYLNDDGTINWPFFRTYRPPADASERERRAHCFFNQPDYFNIYHRTKLLLADWGEYTITEADLEQQRRARATARVLAAEREDRFRRHSAWGRGRKTTSARY